ncbi:hypothetical protein OG196_16225 [Kitasatospora purpeofusca]|uniref:hypothetical protein n=1 Tax=Kitasatospora purpeofusca TaxID=67352 RepID=UPI002E13597A|nr:hypothetical protein OG196_16225 [Kitasatospora purpeofusca]
MGFPDTPLDVTVQLRLGDTWTDVTADTYLRDPITIERGRHDEGSRIDPGKVALTFDNRSGTYSPRNASGPHYGLLGRNTPVRIAVADPSIPTYLDLPGAGSYATTPDTAALDITGDLDVRVDLTQAAAQPGAVVEVAAKYELTGNQRSWQLTLFNGNATLRWSTNGTTVIDAFSTDPFPFPVSGRIAVRAALDVDNGAGGWTVRFWSAPTLAGPWTPVGQPITGAGTTSVYASTAPLTVGDNPGQIVTPLTGRIHAFELRNGAGTVVAATDFTALAPGTTTWTDPAGRTWTLHGDATIPERISGRITAEISSWPPRRDVSGTDAWVQVEAAGIKRRLGQGTDPLASSLRRSLTAAAPIAYWPCEDARGSTQAYSPVPGAPPLRTGGGAEFAYGDGPTGSLPLPRLGEGVTLAAAVPATPDLPDGWQVEMVYRLDELPPAGSYPQLLQIASTGTVVLWTISIAADVVAVRGYDVNGTFVTNTGSPPGTTATGGWARLRLQVRESAGTVSWDLRWFLIGQPDFEHTFNFHTGSAGRPTAIDTRIGAGLTDLQIGHLSVMPLDTDAYAHADNGHEGDRGSQRVERLCAEEGVPLVSRADVESQVALGPQQAAPLLDLLEEAAEVDGALLGEDRTSLALRYRPGYQLYGQAPALVLDYAAGDIAPPLEPADDDQTVRNDIEVTRRGGSSARITLDSGPLSVQPPPNGIGRYPDSPELNLYRDDQAAQLASWRLHLGTWDAARYPRVCIDLAAAPHLIAAVTALEIGDTIRLVNLPLGDGPSSVDLIVQGYSETVGSYDWTIELNTTPAGPWQVAAVEDQVLGRADTDGSTLATGATSTATTLSISTTTGPLWTTDPAEYPLDLAVAGERVTVTAMSGTTSPQTATAVRSVNGFIKTLPAGADVRLWQPAVLAL